MSKPNTYHVIETISTSPISSPLQDYCRHHATDSETTEEIKKKIEKTWFFIEQKSANDNEKIRIYFDPKIWNHSHSW